MSSSTRTSAGITPTPTEAIARSLLRAFDTGLPFVKFGPDDRPVVLARRKRGEVIEDPDCEHDYEALQNGIYRRYETQNGSKRGFKWMYFCTSDDLADFLDATVLQEITDPVEREAIALNAAWQSSQWKDNQEKQARRDAQAAARRAAASQTTNDEDTTADAELPSP